MTLIITIHAGSLAGLLALVACSSTPAIDQAPPPPAATLQIDPDPRQPTVTRAQAIWIGDRILTAAHVLVHDYEESALMSEFLLNGDPVRVLDAQSGDLATVARLYSRSGQDPPDASAWVEDWLEDWVVAQVSMSAPASIPLHVCDCAVRAGDKLYMVGFPPDENEPRLRALPLTVLDFSVKGDGPDKDALAAAVRQRLVAVRSPTRADLRGWSGSFVGHYDADREQWCYIGLLTFGVDDDNGRRTNLVLRPPPVALRLLMEGD